MYTCKRCGKKVQDAFNITRWFNGYPEIEVVCEECIKKIGYEEAVDDAVAE